MEFVSPDTYHKPTVCRKCEGAMIFKGVGEYQCEKCKAVDYDDYGVVRIYIEKHHGATAAQIEEATGISQRTIRQMLKEERLEVAKDSVCFLQCEICGANIRFGRLCDKCQKERQNSEEMQRREAKKKNLQIHSMNMTGEKGEKRFKR